MPAILAVLGTALGKVLLSMITALFTEKFLKVAIVHSLEKLAQRTLTDFDDKLLKAAKEAWGMDEKDKEEEGK